jgi:hypothetical protein
MFVVPGPSAHRVRLQSTPATSPPSPFRLFTNRHRHWLTNTEAITAIARLGAQANRAEPRRLCPDTSDIDLFRYGKGVVNLDAEVPHGTFDPIARGQ